MVDQGGRLPLHLAAASGASEAVLVMLVDALPMSVEAVDFKGLTPIHMLFRYHANKTPPNLNVKHPDDDDDDRYYTEHTNTNDNADEQDWTSTATSTPEYNTTTIHNNANLVSMMASRKSTRAVAHHTKQLPLHVACRNVNVTSIDVLQILVVANPDALIAVDSKGRTPLMLILLNCWTTKRPPVLAVVELLLGRVRCSTAGLHSAASIVAGYNNNTNTISADQMRLLVHNPAAKLAASMASTETGELPLHVAAQVHASVAVIQILYDAYPDAIETEDLRGRMPLHHVLVNNVHRLPSPAVLNLLLTERVARSRDVDGKYPIDYLFDIEDLDLFFRTTTMLL